ncbi:MAG TPA: hypothetical protein VMX97_16875 [Hyphomicrobiaceae bacterium]|nr:hypothetical protein [Hyphomicrobiaceae bacterium]
MMGNRETMMLYKHLRLPNNSWVATIVTGAVDDVNGKPDLWSDYGRQVGRVLARNLRTEAEDIFEGFYFGGTQEKDTALMCQEVGSLWRVHWQELAAQLLEDEKINLDPPEDE